MDTIKFIKKLDNGFLIQELILTKEGEKLVHNLQNKGVSEDGIQSILSPYDTVKKCNECDSKYVEFSCQYFKKSI